MKEIHCWPPFSPLTPQRQLHFKWTKRFLLKSGVFRSIDPGTRPGLVRITAIRIQHEFSISRFRFSLYHWIDDQLLTDFRPLHDITAFTLNAPELTLTLSGNDPHFEFCGDWERIQESITHVQRQMAFLFSSLSFAAAAMIYGILYFFRTTSDRFFKKILAIMQWVLLFIKDIYDKRYTIYELTRRDFKSMYTGSLLGLTWSFVQPLAMTGVLWFVFSKGFRALPIENVPFIVWMLCGLVPWYFFSNCLVTNTSVLMEYGYLVKKTNFRVSYFADCQNSVSPDRACDLYRHFVNLFIRLSYAGEYLLASGVLLHCGP